jgi:hypothetical protein
MATSSQNSVSSVLYAPPDSGELEELQELNLLFLIHLRNAAREAADCLGLPARHARRLRELPMSRLESIADFPRSLFILDLDNISAASERHVPDRLESSRRSLALTVLHSAWNMSRRRDFQARLFLRLPREALHRLRTTSLSELPLIATSPSLLHCRFAGADSMWRTLLTEDNFEMTRVLRMVALHPDVERHKPSRLFALDEPNS